MSQLEKDLNSMLFPSSIRYFPESKTYAHAHIQSCRKVWGQQRKLKFYFSNLVLNETNLNCEKYADALALRCDVVYVMFAIPEKGEEGIYHFLQPHL